MQPSRKELVGKQARSRQCLAHLKRRLSLIVCPMASSSRLTGCLERNSGDGGNPCFIGSQTVVRQSLAHRMSFCMGRSKVEPKSRFVESIAGIAAAALIGGTLAGCCGVEERPAPPPPPRAAAPAPTPAPAPPKEKLVLRGVHFDFNKSAIRKGDAAVLDEAAAALKANPGVTVNVNGYCDAIGSVKYNQKLSERRSESVVKYLVGAGIPASQLVPHGYGKTDFVATNDTAEGRAQNRRVELVPAQ
jgi:outer membrane protein OmpA-like peptidoglycan-associated protein